MSTQYAINTELKEEAKAGKLENHFAGTFSKRDFAANYLSYLSDLMRNLDLEIVENIIETLIFAGERGKSIYFIGNGGSAATASHCANDISIGTRASGHKPFKATSLADNLAILTALSNDRGYSNIFVMQLEEILQTGDVVIAFSVSGNSLNVIKALQYAKGQGATTIGCTGFDGGKMHQLADICLHVPTHKGEYGPVEDIFNILGHLIYSYIKIARKGRL